MPTYAYACKDCSHSFDIQQSFSEDSLTVCPECGGRLRKKFNSVGVVFKGSGFYRTDSRDAASTVPAAPAKTESSTAPATTSGSGTSAPAATANSGGAQS
ncbi:FmdB family transcriptional regulator [Arthrobacter sp. zg-Y859]|uniref:FmdB family transcriptional regulator n=1 Tax=Arthrobacter jinronghuae TaxID=2964609 RepID=A0ABT1NRG8_9MICC|nr:FmdB family zinc ribbon protein [Arthrobacter jinronghuae]MCQ1949349.1 FmdB family transcriptional regulator [Arthrobacter jinronghuae]UWX77873.1 FmdB family transcriptional regulator [Arthrobacter jinronghuae]